MEEDGLVKIGIDDFLQHITGPLTRVKLKSPGERVKKGKYILSIIQEGKQLEVYAPVSGTIKEHNKILETDSSLINSLFKILANTLISLHIKMVGYIRLNPQTG